MLDFAGFYGRSSETTIILYAAISVLAIGVAQLFSRTPGANVKSRTSLNDFIAHHCCVLMERIPAVALARERERCSRQSA